MSYNFVTSSISAKNGLLNEKGSEQFDIDVKTRGAHSSTFIGYGVPTGLFGYSNTLIGYEAGLYATQGINLLLLGVHCGMSNRGDDNIMIGNNAGQNNETGSGLIFIGHMSGACNIKGFRGLYLGHFSGITQKGDENLYIGYANNKHSYTIFTEKNLSIGHYSSSTADTTLSVGFSNFMSGNKSIVVGNYIVDSNIENVIIGNDIRNYGRNCIIIKNNHTSTYENRLHNLINIQDRIVASNDANSNYVLKFVSDKIVVQTPNNTIDLAGDQTAIRATSFRIEVSCNFDVVANTTFARQTVFNGEVTTNNALTVNGTLVVNSNLLINTPLLNITGAVNMLSNVDIKGVFQAYDKSYFKDAVNMLNTLNVSGYSYFQNTITASNDIIVRDNLYLLNGTASFCNNLLVKGTTTLQGPLYSLYNSTFSNNVNVYGDTTLEKLNVNGRTNLYSNTYIYGNLENNGLVTFKEDINARAGAYFTNGFVACNTILSKGNLFVEGITTLSNQVIAKNIFTCHDTATFTKEVITPNLVSSNTTITGYAFFLKNTEFSGVINANNVANFHDNVVVDGYGLFGTDIYSSNNIVAKGGIYSYQDAGFCNDVDIKETLTTNILTANGNTTLQYTTIQGNTVLNSNLYANQDVFIQGNLDIDKNVNIDGSLNVVGEGTFTNIKILNSAFNLSNNMSVSGHSTFNGITTFSNDIFALKNATFCNLNVNQLTKLKDVEIDGQTHLLGDVIAHQKMTFCNSTYFYDDVSFSNDTVFYGPVSTSNLTVDGDLEVKGTLVFRENVSVWDVVDIHSDLNVHNNTHLKNNLIVDGNTSFCNNVIFGDGVLFKNDTIFDDIVRFNSNIEALSISTNTLQSHNTSLNSNTTIWGNLVDYATSIFNGLCTFNSNIVINGRTIINGEVTFSNDATFSNAYTTHSIIEHLDVLESANFINDATFSKDALVMSNLRVNENLFVDRGQTTYGDATFCNNLDVYGTTTLHGPVKITGQTEFSNNVFMNDLRVKHVNADIVTVNSNLSVVGNTTLCNLECTGTFTQKGLSIFTGEAQFSNDVIIHGDSFVQRLAVSDILVTDSAIIDTNLICNSNIDIQGISLLNDVLINNDVYVKGYATFCNGFVSLDDTIFNAPAQFNSNLIASTASIGTLTITDIANINGILNIAESNLIVSGCNFANYIHRIANLSSFEASNTTFLGNVGINCNLTVNTLNVRDVATFSNRVNFIDSSNIYVGACNLAYYLNKVQYLNAGSNTFQAGSLDISGTATMSNLVVSGTATFCNNCYFGLSNIILGGCNLAYYLNKVGSLNSFDAESNTFLGNVKMNSNLYIQGFILSEGDITSCNDIYSQKDVGVTNDLYVGNNAYFNQLFTAGVSTFNEATSFESAINFHENLCFIDGCNLQYYLNSLRHMDSVITDIANRFYEDDSNLATLSNEIYADVGTTFEETILAKSNVIIEGALIVKGKTLLQGIQMENVGVTNMNVTGLDVNGPSVFRQSSVFQNDIVVYGNSTLCNNVAIGGSTTINGPVTLYNSENIYGGLTVRGVSTFSNNVVISGRLTLNDSFTIGSNLNMLANATVKNSFTVGGMSTFCNLTTFNSNVIVKGVSGFSNQTFIYDRLTFSKSNNAWSLYTTTNTSNNTYSDLIFKSANNTSVVFTDDFEPGTFNFTGSHRCAFEFDNSLMEDMIGKIVISRGSYNNLENKSIIEIDEAVPVVELATKSHDKRVFGVISGFEEKGTNSRFFKIGNLCFNKNKSKTDTKVVINGVGEGAIWICNINGSLQNGDLITTSEIDGYGMKQENHYITNYTVAKITCDCEFSLDNPTYKCVEFVKNGVKLRKAFVGCIYKC